MANRYPEKPPYSNAHIPHDRNEAVATGMLLGRDTIEQWEHGGHLWRIDAIEKVQIGASLRRFELFMDNEPASGGRYHSTIEHAKERAKFVAEGSMHDQITYLWSLVNDYRNKRVEDVIAMDCALEYIENTKGKGADGTADLLRSRMEI